MMRWRVAEGKWVDLPGPGEGRAAVLGILNVTPDSFSDGGKWSVVEAAVAHAERMVAEGAVGVDIGGESTRPGAARVSELEQIGRVVPVIEGVRERLGTGVVVTIDTTRAAVARAALEAGADGVNDVSGGAEDAGMLGLVAGRGCGVVLMHRGMTPERDVYSTARHDNEHPDVIVGRVCAALEGMAGAALAAGVARKGIVLDPGLGFGKTVEQNLALIRKTGEFAALGYPVLSGLSRKSFTCRPFGLPDGTPPERRVDATLALSRLHRRAGARLFRVHDVVEHVTAFAAESG